MTYTSEQLNKARLEIEKILQAAPSYIRQEYALNPTAYITKLLDQASTGNLNAGDNNFRYSLAPIATIAGATYKPEDINTAKQALIKSGNTNPSDTDAINYISSTGANFGTESNKAINTQSQVNAASVPQSQGVEDANSVTNWINSGSTDDYATWLSKQKGTSSSDQTSAYGKTGTGIVNPQTGKVEEPTSNATGSSTEGATTTTTSTGVDYTNIDKIIADALKSGQITQADADLASRLVRQYNSPTITYDNIIKEFQKIATTSISPEFRERANKYIGDVNFIKQQNEAARARELETERFNTGENIRQAQGGLEEAGMIFSGKAVETLGGKSAYAQPEPTMGGQITTTISGDTVEYDPTTGKILRTISTAGQIPTQTGVKDETGTTRFYEGTVNQANRLMSSGSQARYESQLQDIGRKAEDYLGTDRAGLLGIDYQPIGGVTGSVQKEEEQAKASTLSNLFQNYGTNEQRTSTQLNG